MKVDEKMLKHLLIVEHIFELRKCKKMFFLFEIVYGEIYKRFKNEILKIYSQNTVSN